MKLWISNLPPAKSDEEVRDFIRKYTEIDVGVITRIDGEGTRPGVLIGIDGASQAMLTVMQRRLNRLYWDSHELVVQIMYFGDQG